MRTLIFGGGAVGLGIASCLIKSGCETDILDRRETISAIKNNGIKRTGIFGDFNASSDRFGCYESFSEIKNKTYDYIAVCTKSNDSMSAAQEISRNIPAESIKCIVLFQNGWGNAEIFASVFPESVLYSARVITGFKKHNLNTVEITVHAESIHIGSLYDNDIGKMKDLCRAISEGGIPSETTESIEKDLWAKMLYNCTLNPLGAIFRAPYGRLGESEYARSLIKSIAEEIFNVLKKTGCTTHWDSAENYLKVFYAKLLPPTAKHEASMLQDIKAGRKTEIDALNGAVVKLGDSRNVDVSVNRTIMNMIRFIENDIK